MNSANTLDLVRQVTAQLESAGVQVWLCGGWAEELRGLRPPRPHHDIDLAFPGKSLARIDQFLRTTPAVREICAKRFTHKRAFEVDGVMVEVLLAEPAFGGHVTRFFGGQCVFAWPVDAFTSPFQDPEARGPSRVLSAAALAAYRENHQNVRRAYQAHFAQR